jgi:uncharacterized protein (TIGR02118 family)
MITISILFPATSAARFDFDYYVGSHVPRSIELLSRHPGFLGTSVKRGAGKPSRRAEPAFVAACFYTFDSIEALLAAFTPSAIELHSDMSNYTDIEPLIQFQFDDAPGRAGLAWCRPSTLETAPGARDGKQFVALSTHPAR